MFTITERYWNSRDQTASRTYSVEVYTLGLLEVLVKHRNQNDEFECHVLVELIYSNIDEWFLSAGGFHKEIVSITEIPHCPGERVKAVGHSVPKGMQNAALFTGC